MYIIRPIEHRDEEAFIRIAFEAGIGMTSMPKNRSALLHRLASAVDSFACTPQHPGNEHYLFVLEDTKSGQIGGVSGLIAKSGMTHPLSFFRIMRNEAHRGIDGKEKIAPLLRVVHYRNYWSEICSLYLCRDHRHSGLGRLLSLSRFHFIAWHPERFDKMLFAEMRGNIDENNVSNFWEGIGRHFIDTTFEQLMQLRDEKGIDLREVLPVHPIYVELLPKDVQATIGKLHDNTVPAFKLLQDEGFIKTDEVDIFDGGPKVAVETKTIRTIKTSRQTIVGGIDEAIKDSPLYLLSRIKPTFRACLSQITLHKDGSALLPKETAEALQVNVGDNLCFSLAESKEHSTKEAKP